MVMMWSLSDEVAACHPSTIRGPVITVTSVCWFVLSVITDTCLLSTRAVLPTYLLILCSAMPAGVVGDGGRGGVALIDSGVSRRGQYPP